MQSKKSKKNDDTHILKMWTPLSYNVDKNYKFIPKSWIFKIFSNLLYIIALPIVYIYNKIAHGLKINGMENLLKVNGGKIIVSNHIHPMDCTFAEIAVFPDKLYYPTIKSNFEIPVISTIIRLLNAIPIPEKLDAKKKFVVAIDELLQEGKTIIFYPEGSMWPYYDKLRSFKKGPFEIAVKNNVPIVPIVYTYRIPRGIRRITNKKPLITLNILKEINVKEDGNDYEKAIELRNEVYNKMNEMLIKK